MRIAIWYNLPSGGAKRSLYDQVRGLVARGHHVEAWAPSTRDASYLPLTDLVEEHVLPIDYAWSPTRAERLGLSSRARTIAATMDAHCRACAVQIDAGGFDVLFANSCIVTASAPIARYVALPSVLYLHEPARILYEAWPQLIWAAPARERPSLGAIRRRLVDRRDLANARIRVREEIASARAFDRILCNSYYSRESILRAYGIAARVCYLGIDAALFEAGGDEREPTVIGLGALNGYKGEDRAIDAVALMKAARPKLLWIANSVDAGRLAELHAHAAARGVALEVKVRVADEELVRCLGRATAMIYAPRLEPFGYAPLEANACATPVVAAAEGGVRETVVDGLNGLLADPDPASLAAALDRLFADPALARRLGRQARAAVLDRWSLGGGIDRIEEQLRQVAGARGPRS